MTSPAYSTALRPLPMSMNAASMLGQHVLHPAEVDVADDRGLRLERDVVLDEDVVLEHGDLGGLAALADRHHPLDRLAAGQELRLAQDRRTAAAGLAALAAALLLGLDPGRALDAGDRLLLGARLADLRGGGAGRSSLALAGVLASCDGDGADGATTRSRTRRPWSRPGVLRLLGVLRALGAFGTLGFLGPGLAVVLRCVAAVIGCRLGVTA